jgi:hypothetical protein
VNEGTIDVMCFVFPDGSTFFIPTDDIGHIDRAREVMEAWKARLQPDVRQRYEEAQVMGGFVWMHMLKEDYRKLPATQLAHELCKAVGVA